MKTYYVTYSEVVEHTVKVNLPNDFDLDNTLALQEIVTDSSADSQEHSAYDFQVLGYEQEDED